MSAPHGVQHERYLGDGVYAGYDGYHIVLWLNEPGYFGPNTIGLEPAVLAALANYCAAVGARVVRTGEDRS